ncbi:MAG: murein biosynthesis integral membrane protein MurJ [bacterium]|nr:murein biosynthesis integral membrane protein MurJ [bacterium]
MKIIKQGSIILIITSAISVLLGLLRDRLLAGRFGASGELDIYYAAFRIPDFIYAIIIGGGILVAFLPVFAQEFKENEQSAWRLANNVLNIFFIFLVLGSIFLFLLSPILIQFVAPGFSIEQKSMAIFLTRILFLSPIIFGVANLFSSILNHFHRFLVYGLGPVFYNLGIIFGILYLAPKYGIFGVTLGVVFGAFLFLITKIPSIYQCGFRYSFLVDFKDKQMKKIFKLMIPRVLSSSAAQLNWIVMTALASFLGAGAISVFSFSNNLQLMPQQIVAFSISTAVFPLLAKNSNIENIKEFLKSFWYSFEKIILLTAPLALILFIFSTPIIKIILMTGKFSLVSVELTAMLLKIFSVSIVFNSLYSLVVRAFFALHDTKIPTIATFLGVAINVLLSVFFLFYFFIGAERIYGLALAFTISSIFEFCLLFLLLNKKIKNF